MLVKHTLGIEADETFWKSMGWQVHLDFDGGKSIGGKHQCYHADELLGIAIGSGLSGEKAIAWVSAEAERRKESAAHVYAIGEHAKAIASLAKSLANETKAEVMKQIMAHITEPTQYALRQQLKGSGLLP